MRQLCHCFLVVVGDLWVRFWLLLRNKKIAAAEEKSGKPAENDGKWRQFAAKTASKLVV